MKLLFYVLTLYSLPSFALYSVSLESPIPGTAERIEISQSEDGWHVLKTSNALNPKDYRLGKLKIPSSNETEKLLKRIQKVEEEITSTEKLVSDSKDIDIKRLMEPGKGSHEDYVTFNKRILSKKSPFFEEIQSIVKDFSKLPMVLQDGARLDDKQENLELLKSGKKVDSFKFVKGAYCEGVEKDLKCRVRDWGIIYIQ